MFSVLFNFSDWCHVKKPQSRAWGQNKHDSEKKKKDAAHDDIDDWELPHVGIPYTWSFVLG